MEVHRADSLSSQNTGAGAQRWDLELRALSRISAALSGLSDLDAILMVALDSTLEVMNGAIGGILLLDEPSQTLYYRVHKGLSARYVGEMRMRLGEGVAGRVAQSGKSVLLEDISAEPSAAHKDLVTTEGLRAFMSVPLRGKERVLGVINVASLIARSFTTHDMLLLNSIGDQLSVAIEQAQLYERLKNARERYRKLARQTLVAEEEERRRIARELHDETSQTLSGLALQLQALIEMAEMSGSQSAEFIARLKNVQSLGVQVHNEVSRIIADLRPALLDTLGVVPAVRNYAERILRPLGINVSLETKGVEKRLPTEVEAGVFRWCQGAIGNVAEHSKAQNAIIVLECRDDELFVRISDDGQGFDVSKVTNIEESGRGRGLFSMKERIGLLGGICSVESQPSQGTTVWTKVPIRQSAQDAKNKGTGSG